jgi:Flp pilus assembly pilin Flp
MQFALWDIYSGLQRLIQQEEGQDLVEYALVVALVSIVAAATVGSFGQAVVALINYIVTHYLALVG